MCFGQGRRTSQYALVVVGWRTLSSKAFEDQLRLSASPFPNRAHKHVQLYIMPPYDVDALERILENSEHNDTEAQKLYNNLGLAHAANRNFRASLKAHREEKTICKRLLAASPHDAARHLDLAIAYRRCGDVIPKLDRLVNANNVRINKREDIIRAAQTQHSKGLNTARNTPMNLKTRPLLQLELQAASAALAQSTLSLADHTLKRAHFIDAVKASARAARLANSLEVGHAGLSHSAKQSLLLGIALNHALGFSGLGDKKRARLMLHAVAMRARALDDHSNLVRALSNLGEEASDECEWDLCEAYTREWVRLARRAEDHCDEADALRKLAVVLREVGDLHGAETALNSAIRLPGSAEGKVEAKTFLKVIQQDIVEHDLARKELKTLQRDAEVCMRRGEYTEEAKLRIAAGNCAFTLRNSDLVVEILGRYFELVDDFGCNAIVTGVEECVHNSAIANMGEAYWKLKNHERAVHWATRELSVFDGDLPGQAQAWCNLGVYLDDYGKKERAMDALRQSIEIASKCGETDTKARAEGNLQLIEREVRQKANMDKGAGGHKNSNEKRHSDEGIPRRDSGAISQHTIACSTGSFIRRKRVSVELNEAGANEEIMCRDDAGEKSIIIDSSQPLKKVKTHEAHNHNSRGAESSYDMKRTCTSTKQSMRGGRHRGEQMMSARSRDTGMEELLSSGGFKNIVDVVAEYRAICGRSQRQGIRVRPMIVNALRDVRSTLLSREARDQRFLSAARLNLSGLLVDGDDLSVICQALSIVGAEHDVFFDLSLNPMINESAYDCMNSRKFSSPVILHSIKQLDLSCAGLSAETVRKLADALNEQGALSYLTSIALGKNALGRHGRATAVAVARMLCCPSQLRSMDLSLNMLSNSFLPDLTERLQNAEGKDTLSVSLLQTLNLSLNNRRGPTGLLETSHTRDMLGRFSQLFKSLPSLVSVDVRACGASLEMRRSLRRLCDSFVESNRIIITVYDANLDEDGF